MSIRNKNIPKSTTSSRPAENVDSFPWPEWTDAELNAEKWATGKGDADGLFVDSERVRMPASLIPYEWIRAKDLKHLSEPITVFTTSAKHSNLITNNKHLLHSEFMRWFISAVVSLQFCGRDGLEISGENPNFTWNARQQPWQGWMNIYSMNKTGKGVSHKPIVNPTGKYIARLYFMGCWRRVALDDAIPVDEAGNPLLPRTVNNFELWPMLLAKALLKLASITRTESREIVDFHPVTCLTGWVCLNLSIAHLSHQDKWDFLTKYAEHFEWDPEVVGHNNHGYYTLIPNHNLTSTIIPSAPKIENTGGQEISKDIPLKSKLLNKSRPVTLFVGLKDMRKITSEVVPGLSPCWSHFVHVVQSRDVPLDPKNVKPPLARWKLYRWLKWAIARNLIDPAEYFVPIRYLKIVSPLRECNESIINVNDDAKTREILRQEESTNGSDRKNKTELQGKKSSADPESSLSQWGDFNKMCPYVQEAQLFYKVEHFRYKVDITDDLASGSSKVHKSDAMIRDSRKGSKKSSKKSSPSIATSNKEVELVGTYAWPVKMASARNEPLYLLCDSLDEKFFLIDFSTYDSRPNAPIFDSRSKDEDPVEEDMSIPRCTREKYLLVEPHSWFHRPTHLEPLVSVSTAGTRSVVMELPPGRHLLRIHCNSESHRAITIASDTMFHLGDRWTMHRLMTRESDRLDRTVKRISDCTVAALESFGTKNYPSALKSYYQSYLMDMRDEIREKDKTLRKQAQDLFMNEQVALIREIFLGNDAKEILRSLRIFFMNPSIARSHASTESRARKRFQLHTTVENLQAHPWNDKDTPRSHRDEGRSDNRDRAAAVIQSFFKMLLIRRYKETHDAEHERHKVVFDNLQTVARLFDYTKGESLARRILTNAMKRHEGLSQSYPCSKDLQHVVHVQQISGTLRNVRPGQWVPIVRLVVNPREYETVFAAVDLFADLPSYTLRIFNNETNREILRIANNAVPARYRYAKTGYTVFGYGWSEDLKLKESDWRMHVTSVKGEPVFYLENEEPLPLEMNLPSLMVDEFSDTYVPNSRNCITRWILGVKRRSFVSLRLRTSYESARVRLQVVNERDDVVCKVEGRWRVILPVACLEYEESSGKNDGKNYDAIDEGEGLVSRRMYYIEAFVLDDSWPLTEFEWSVVNEAKTKVSSIRANLSSLPTSRPSKSDLGRSRKGSRQSVEENQQLNCPYWVLQVVTDPGSDLEISKDRTKEREIASMKEAWTRENPDYLQLGKQLREEFIKQHAIARSSSLNSRRSSMVVERKSTARRTWDRTIGIDTSSHRPSKKEQRTLKPPQDRDRHLPALDLAKYERKKDERKSSSIKATIVEDSRNVQEKLLKRLTEALKNQRETYERFFRVYKENFWDRRKLVNEAYEDRKSYIESTRPTMMSGKTKGKGKKAGRTVA